MPARDEEGRDFANTSVTPFQAQTITTSDDGANRHIYIGGAKTVWFCAYYLHAAQVIQ
jgi:hypothetical protein